MKNIKTRKQNGQSFIELAVIFMVLITMLAGVVEFGYLLNQYITLVEGTRETARVASKGDPFTAPGNGIINQDFLDTVTILLEGGVVESRQILGSIEPISLDPSINDDIVISVFTFASGGVVRYPDVDGWSRYDNQVSRFTNADIQAKLVGGSPDTGAILIEVYYHYHQILNLMEGWTGPILVHAYSIMPLSAAEPTEGP